MLTRNMLDSQVHLGSNACARSVIENHLSCPADTSSERSRLTSHQLKVEEKWEELKKKKKICWTADIRGEKKRHPESGVTTNRFESPHSGLWAKWISRCAFPAISGVGHEGIGDVLYRPSRARWQTAVFVKGRVFPVNPAAGQLMGFSSSPQGAAINAQFYRWVSRETTMSLLPREREKKEIGWAQKQH